MNEFETTALELTKARLGISTPIRDTLLRANIRAILDELKNEQGLKLKADSSAHLMFIVDYATWRYQSVNDTQTTSASRPLSMPRHLQFRLHNLIVSNVKKDGG